MYGFEAASGWYMVGTVRVCYYDGMCLLSDQIAAFVGIWHRLYLSPLLIYLSSSIFNPLLIFVSIYQQCLLPLQNLLPELKYRCLRFAQIRGVRHGLPSSALIVLKDPSLSSWLGQCRKDSEEGAKTWAAQLVLNLDYERE